MNTLAIRMIARSVGTASRPVPTRAATHRDFDSDSTKEFAYYDANPQRRGVRCVDSSNHVVGTFTFDAAPNGTSTSPTMHVTNGTFDLTF